jgi:hypothetical protein
MSFPTFHEIASIRRSRSIRTTFQADCSSQPRRKEEEPIIELHSHEPLAITMNPQLCTI